MQRLAVAIVCLAAFAGCGADDPRVAACTELDGRLGESGVCSVAYAGTDYDVYLLPDGALDLESGTAVEDCIPYDEFFRVVHHEDTLVCEQIPLTAYELVEEDEPPSRARRANALLDDARDRLCDGRGGGALKLAERANRLRRSAKARALIRDARALIAQQRENNRLSDAGVPDEEIPFPAVLVKRGCAPVEEVLENAPGDDDCSDFSSQEAAQAHLDAYGDASGLDADGDGIACESL